MHEHSLVANHQQAKPFKKIHFQQYLFNEIKFLLLSFVLAFNCISTALQWSGLCIRFTTDSTWINNHTFPHLRQNLSTQRFVLIQSLRKLLRRFWKKMKRNVWNQNDSVGVGTKICMAYKPNANELQKLSFPKWNVIQKL